jgi:hypothetical protein
MQFHVIHCTPKTRRRRRRRRRKKRLFFSRFAASNEIVHTTVFLGTREFVPAVESVISGSLLAFKDGDVKWRKLGNSGSNKEV